MHPKAAMLRRSTLPRTTARGRTLITLGLIPLYALCFVAIKAGLPFALPLQFAGLRSVRRCEERFFNACSPHAMLLHEKPAW